MDSFSPESPRDVGGGMCAGDEQRGAEQTRDGTLFQLAERAVELLDADGAAVALSGPRGYVVESAVALFASLRGQRLAIGAVAPEPPATRADAARAINDPAPDASAAGPLEELTGAEHTVAVPLRLDDRIRGVLVVGNAAEGGAFDEADGRMLSLLAEGAAASLETAHLRRELTDLERALTESNAELARAVRARDDFFSRINHELRTPLNAVLCYGELLRDAIFGELNPKQHQAVERLQAAGRRLRGLVDDALEFRELQATDMLLAAEPIDLGELAADVVASLYPEAEREGLLLTVDTASEPVMLELDGVRTRRVLLILCSQAINLVERGTVALRVYPTAEGGGVEITGSGEGLRPAGFERLLHGFTEHLPGPDGAGFELAVARRLAARLGGRLTVEQPTGGGMRFLLVLPTRVPAGA